MNSQFKNSNLGFYLYAFIILIIAVASVFVFWYMTVGYRVGTYPEDTRLGSVYIGGLTEEEVAPKVRERIAIWNNDDSIFFQLEYQGYTYTFDRNLFYFDLELSTFNLTDGETNQISVYYQSDDRTIVVNEISSLPFLVDIADEIDLNSLINDILYDASLMKSYSSKNVEDYFLDPEAMITEIDSATFQVPETVDIDTFIGNINAIYEDGKIMVPEKSLFDIIEAMSSELSDSEMTVLSSGMLQTILNTNFLINEVNYNPIIDFGEYTIDNYPMFGRNSSINKVVGENFTFYNPNESDYYFTVEKTDESSGLIKLWGLEFVSTIETELTITEIDYITQLTTNATLLQNGHEGAVVTVHRTITDVYDDVVYDKDILFEFYPPIKEIILEP